MNDQDPVFKSPFYTSEDFTKDLKDLREANKEPPTHDYTDPRWGRNFNIVNLSRDGQTANLTGWGRGLKVGHYLLLKNGHDNTRYKITSIEYMRDPADMWAAAVTFAPRTTL